MFKPAQRSWSILELSYRDVTVAGIVVEIVVEVASLSLFTNQYEQKVRIKVCNPMLIL